MKRIKKGVKASEALIDDIDIHWMAVRNDDGKKVGPTAVIVSPEFSEADEAYEFVQKLTDALQTYVNLLGAGKLCG